MEHEVTFLLLTVCPESWIGVLATVDILSENWQGTFMYMVPRFPFVHELFAARLPHVQCVWVSECSIIIGRRVYNWEQIVPLYSGIAITFLERIPPHQQVFVPIADPDGTSVGTSEGLYTASSASSDASSLGSDTHHVQMSGQWPGPFEAMSGENTATPLYSGQSSSLMGQTGDNDDATCFMQRTVATASFVPFAVACERGLPYIKTLRLTRRELTQAWQELGVDVVYEHFRSRENGIWEKKIMGWSFLRYGQLQGEPFTIWMRRTGLWATQLISPFEDEGVLAVHFVFVFPQPTMTEIAGNGRNEHDVVVVALTDETAAEDSLPLVIQLELSGIMEHVAVHCPPGCTPNTLCALLGFEHVCNHPMQGVASFSYGDIKRTFVGHERIGLPAGALIRLFAEALDESCGLPLPVQEPFREHQTLLIARRDFDDQQSFMQLPWMAEMESDELEFQEAARRLYRFEHLFPDGRLRELYQIKQDAENDEDLVRQFLAEHFELPGTRVFTVYAWIVAHEVAAYARIIPLQIGRSMTQSLLRELADIEEAQPFWIMSVDPVMAPLSLRIFPLDLIILTQPQLHARVRIYLIDILYARLPKRVATLYKKDETFRDLTRRLGLESICDRTVNRCVLMARTEEGDVEWGMQDVVDQNHGSHFVLEFRIDECRERGSPYAPSSKDTDAAAFMQVMHKERAPRSLLHIYLRQFASRELEVTFWVHDREAGFAQLYPDRCPVKLSSEAVQQCQHLWTQRGMDENSRVTLVDPAPVFLVLPRPHVIIDNDSVEGCPILCQTIEDGRMNLLSIVLPRSFPPTSVSFLFTFAVPQNDCDRDSECYLYWERRRYEHWQDIPIAPGAFVKLYEWTRGAEISSSTSCGSPGSDQDIVTWTSEFSGNNGVSPFDEGQDSSDLDVDDVYPTNEHRDHQGLLTTGRWTRRFRVSANRDGVVPYPEPVDVANEQSHEDSADVDDASLMQQWQASTLLPEIRDIDYPRVQEWYADARTNDHPSPEIGDIDYPRVSEMTDTEVSIMFQIQVRICSDVWLQRPVMFLEQFETLQQERNRFLEWRRKVEQTRRTTAFVLFDSFYGEAVAFLAAQDRWPDFVLYSTYDDRVVHWGLAVDEYFVLERYDFATVLRDFLRTAIPFHVPAVVIPVRPLPEIFEQQGEDDLYLLIDEYPDDTEVPVFVSLWVQEGDRPPEMSARRLPQRITTEILLQLYRLEEVCQHARYDCRVSHYTQELPRIVAWRPFPGMKIDIRVAILQDDSCSLPLEQEDGTSFLQFFPAVANEDGWRLCENWETKRPTDGLRPPGNPKILTVWQNEDLDKMDDLVTTEDCYVVIDYPRQALPLDTILPIPELPKQHTRRSVRWLGCDLNVPDFTSWFDAVMVKRTRPCISWKEVSKYFPSGMQAQLHDIILQDPNEITELQIYTDGSNSPDEALLASWSFVAISHSREHCHLIDLDFGLVEIDPMASAWAGAHISDARSAEATAIVRACEWVLAQGLEVPHFFLFDVQSVGLSAAGIYSQPEEDRIGRVARSLAKAVEVLLGHDMVTWRHVKGHSGVLGNELADAIAKWAYHGQHENQVARPDYTPFTSGRRYAIEFLWLALNSAGDSLPSWHKGSLSVPDVEMKTGVAGRLPLSLLATPKAHAVSKIMTLRVCTFNVNTLDPKRGDIVPGFLREQAQWHGFDILFLQETRTRQSNMIQSQTHVRITAAAQQGVGGVEIWLLRRHVNNSRLIFDAKAIQVVIAEPQLLILKVALHGFPLLLVNAHSPHSGAPKETIQSFWDSLQKQLDRLVGSTYLIMGIDANAHFCDELPGCIGAEGLESATN